MSVARTRRKRVKYFTEECDDDESCDAIRDLTARDKGLASGKGGDPLRRSHKKKGKNGFKSFGRPEKGKLATGSPIVSPPKDAWRPKCPKCGRRFSSPLAFQYHDIRFVILLPVFQHFDILSTKLGLMISVAEPTLFISGSTFVPYIDSGASSRNIHCHLKLLSKSSTGTISMEVEI